jgi:hypothetical protein
MGFVFFLGLQNYELHMRKKKKAEGKMEKMSFASP